MDEWEHAIGEDAPEAPAPRVTRPAPDSAGVTNADPRGCGLSRRHFRKVSENGFGDGYNSYAHSMCYFKGGVFVGTSRATMALLGGGHKGGMKDVSLDAWPVELDKRVYTDAFETEAARAEIWRLDPPAGAWTRVYRAPMVHAEDGTRMSRDLGYRAMCVFQGTSDPEPALYVSAWSRSKGVGMQLMRSRDGEHFEPAGPPGLGDLDCTSTRSLIVFKDMLFTSPTGATGGRQNASGIAAVLVSRDPASGDWELANTNGFGNPRNLGVFEMLATEEYLYAGTANLAQGYELWRTRAEGEPPFEWECVLTEGAGRGRFSQGLVSMVEFNGALYLGSGIQKGGIDKQNKIGPAGPELVRFNPEDGSYDVVMGERRTEAGPLSNMLPGWNNVFAGSIYKMGVHDGWLYAGTQDWMVFLLWRDMERLDSPAGRLLQRMEVSDLIEASGGYDLWRTCDGENWVPVTRSGFENPYNHGVRNILSTPHGVYIGSQNQFGPRSAFEVEPGRWEYRDNPRGGTEIWLGTRD